MKENFKTLVLTFSIILNIAFIGATVYYRPSSSLPTGNSPFLYQQLNLSQEQLRQVEPMRDRFHARLREVGGEIKTKQLRLIGLLGAADLDGKAVDALQEEIHDLQQNMQDTIIRHILEETRVFTAEQRKIFFSLMKERIEQSGQPCPPWMRPSEAKSMAGK
jgi:Spy/CpxP family protein refolding chaperone